MRSDSLIGEFESARIVFSPNRSILRIPKKSRGLKFEQSKWSSVWRRIDVKVLKNRQSHQRGDKCESRESREIFKFSLLNKKWKMQFQNINLNWFFFCAYQTHTDGAAGSHGMPSATCRVPEEGCGAFQIWHLNQDMHKSIILLFAIQRKRDLSFRERDLVLHQQWRREFGSEKSYRQTGKNIIDTNSDAAPFEVLEQERPSRSPLCFDSNARTIHLVLPVIVCGLIVLAIETDNLE